MSIALTTRGVICPNSSPALSLTSWGFICFPQVVTGVVEFLVGDQLDAKNLVYNKEFPPFVDSQVILFITPAVGLSGRKSPLLQSAVVGRLASSSSPGISRPQTVQLVTATATQSPSGDPSDASLSNPSDVILSDPADVRLVPSPTS